MHQILKILGIGIIALFLLAPTAFAQVGLVTDDDGDLSVIIVEPDLFVAHSLSTIWLEIKGKESGLPVGGLAVTVAVNDANNKEIFAGPATERIREDGAIHYAFEVTLPQASEYHLDVNFFHEGKAEEFSFNFFASSPQKETARPTRSWPVLTGAIVFGLLLAGTVGWGIWKKQWKMTAILAAVIIGAAILSYSLYVTFRSGATTSGVVTCLDDGRCFWTAHIHSFVVIKACGEEKLLPTEVGSLSATHTHEEKNVFHWHDRLPYDNGGKRLLDITPLTLGASFDAVEVAFERESTFNLKNGDACPDGTLGSWKMFVNGKINQEFRNYVWADRDVIVIIFDSRSAEEIERELEFNPIQFPVLGRG